MKYVLIFLAVILLCVALFSSEKKVTDSLSKARKAKAKKRAEYLKSLKLDSISAN